MNRFPANAFGWVDLSTIDADSAVNFYSKLLHWNDTGNASEDNGFYHMMKLDDGDICGICGMQEEMINQGIPPHWTSYILVDDVNAITERARAAGATIIEEPFDVFTSGRMAIITDPTGATFAIWEPKDHVGATPQNNKPGTFCWNELNTRDVEAAGKFYCHVFGWTLSHDETSEGPIYYEFKNGERVNGGMMAITEEMGPVPPHWNVYFTVANTDESAKQIQDLGGKIIVPPMDIPKVGRFSVALDPQGASFSIIKLDHPEDT